MARDFQNETQRSNLSARSAADSKTGTSRNLNDRSILVAVALNFAVVGLVSLTDLAVRGRPKSRDAKVSCASARQ